MKTFNTLVTEVRAKKVQGPMFLVKKNTEHVGRLKIELDVDGEISLSYGSMFVGTPKAGSMKGKYLAVITSRDLGVTWISKKTFADAESAKASLPKVDDTVSYDDIWKTYTQW